jgi:hypothetical protein
MFTYSTKRLTVSIDLAAVIKALALAMAVMVWNT